MKAKFKECKLFIDEMPFNFYVEGDFFWGEETVLYKEENNVLSNVLWAREGYSVEKVLNEVEFFALKKSIEQNIVKAALISGVQLDNSLFTLETYHQFVKTDEHHQKTVSITRNLELKDFDFDLKLIANRIGELLGCRLTHVVKALGKSHVQLRISRPNSMDINPPHRDGYLSYWENIVNVWMPIAGCNEKSSLPVMPKSHFIPENEVYRTQSKGAVINGNTYYVPCILKTKKGLKMIRPNPKECEALLFTPFLIHGSAINQNPDVTRVALELRFPKI